MCRLSGVLLALVSLPALVAGGCAEAGCEADDVQLLQFQKNLGGVPGYTPKDIRGKSLYFIVVDAFGNPPEQQGLGRCNSWKYGWCNGTIKGITNHLDYIEGMGFEGIWITPVLKQFEGKDPDGRSGYGNYGYWAYDWYDIDEHFGTKSDLKELSDELHKRDMVFVYDIVLNHVGPVHSVADVEKIVPFNKPEYFHQRGIGDMTFDEYAQGYAYGGKGYPPPVQGVGPGAMCEPGPDGGCGNYKCPVDPGFGQPCPDVQVYYGDLDPPQTAPGPRDIPFCGVGDLVCPGYNEEQTIEGWFYDLGDLNHSHEFVHDEFIRWGKHMATTYNLDGFRLDTAPYVKKDFLADFQAAVGIPILGEVTASNWTFFKDFAPKEGNVLKGLLNFYVQNIATPAFCGPPAFFPGADLNLTRLADVIDIEYGSGELFDSDLLGNFVDNHDMQRLALYCQSDMSRMMNAIAWTMFTKGLPIIYYGTELFFTDVHPSMWNTGYPTNSTGYKFIKGLNSVRKEFGLQTETMEVKYVDENKFVFTRGDVWVYLNNYPADYQSSVEYPVALPKADLGYEWVNALSDDAPVEKPQLTTGTTAPAVVVQRKIQEVESPPDVQEVESPLDVQEVESAPDVQSYTS